MPHAVGRTLVWWKSVWPHTSCRPTRISIDLYICTMYICVLHVQYVYYIVYIIYIEMIRDADSSLCRVFKQPLLYELPHHCGNRR